MLTSINTPALLLDYDTYHENLNAMIQFANDQNIQIRPHFKTHKSSVIANQQINAGAIGITVAKISEAEVAVKHGIKDILIAYPIHSNEKINKLINLLQYEDVRIIASVDCIEQAPILQESLQHTSHQLEVWMKINSGLNRCGVEPGPEAVILAKKLGDYPNLHLTGVYTHAGHSYAATSKKEIEKIGKDEAQAVLKSAKACEEAGIHIKHKSVGSTPTYKIAGTQQGITEVRPGNAIFYDAIQVGLGVASYKNCALNVLSSVVGVYKDRIVIDAGSKTLCLDKGAHGNESVKGFGHILEYPHLEISRLSEEHGVIPLSEGPIPKLNEKIHIIPNHACTVVNMFDNMIIHQEGKIIDNWKVDARGCNQ